MPARDFLEKPQDQQIRSGPNNITGRSVRTPSACEKEEARMVWTHHSPQQPTQDNFTRDLGR